MVSGPEVAANLDAAARLLAEAAAGGAALAVLPEYFCLIGRRDTDKLDVAETPGEGPIQPSWPTLRAATACGSSAAPCR
jgi:predicted amidohydrolase